MMHVKASTLARLFSNNHHLSIYIPESIILPIVRTMGYKSGRLFEVPISDNGKVVVTRLGERVYMLMWNSAPDNRLTTVSISCPFQSFVTDFVSISPSVMPCTLRLISWRSSILTAL